jgi:hypothetical protein
MRRVAAMAALALALLPMSAHASDTKFWTIGSYEEFLAGELKGISIVREGSISVAPEMTEVFSTDDAMIWATARDSKGNLYLGTGHSGKVYKLSVGSDGKMKGEQVYDAAEPDVFAIAIDKSDRVYVATSPDGKIYRLENNGRAQEFFDPRQLNKNAKYIWSMVFGADGALYVGTGDRGSIYRVDASGKGTVYYETNQTHVMTLAGKDGELFAGTEPNGLLYKITGANKAQVIYDSPLGEIHRLAFGNDGSIYAATMGAAPATRPQQAATATTVPQLIASTTITVRADDPSPTPSPDGQPDQPQVEASQPQTTLRVANAPVPRTAAATGANRSAVVKIAADGTTETLWESTSENAFDLLPSPDRLMFSTDEDGRIYEVSAAGHELRLVSKTDQEQTTNLIPLGNSSQSDGLLATTANLGKVYRMAGQSGASGTFESTVKDAGNLSNWGQIRWKAQAPPATSVELATRTGNSAKPDATWSEWSAAYKAGAQSWGGQQITSPPGKYIQWRATLRAANGQAPMLQEVTLAYLPRNRAPEITELKLTPRGASTSAQAGATQRGAQRLVGNAQNTGQSAPQRGLDISWLTTDPDQDDLIYNLYFRGESEREWKLLEPDMKQNYYQLGPNSLPDGSYRLRVTASDAADNTPAAARTDERISEPFLVDFTPPQIEVLGVDRNGASATVRWKATDVSSFLTSAEFAVDAESATPASPQDGIVDSREESFVTQFSNLSPKEHLVTIRVTDFAGNAATGKAVLPPAPSQ